MSTVEEQARAEAEKRRLPTYGTDRPLFIDGYLAGHEAAQPPCDGGCSYGDGPIEDCSRHGRPVDEVWQILRDAKLERDDARAARDQAIALTDPDDPDL